MEESKTTTVRDEMRESERDTVGTYLWSARGKYCIFIEIVATRGGKTDEGANNWRRRRRTS